MTCDYTVLTKCHPILLLSPYFVHVFTKGAILFANLSKDSYTKHTTAQKLNNFFIFAVPFSVLIVASIRDGML